MVYVTVILVAVPWRFLWPVCHPSLSLVCPRWDEFHCRIVLPIQTTTAHLTLAALQDVAIHPCFYWLLVIYLHETFTCTIITLTEVNAVVSCATVYWYYFLQLQTCAHMEARLTTRQRRCRPWSTRWGTTSTEPNASLWKWMFLLKEEKR